MPPTQPSGPRPTSTVVRRSWRVGAIGNEVGKGTQGSLVASVGKRRVVGGDLGRAHVGLASLDQLAHLKIGLAVRVGAPLTEAFGHLARTEPGVHHQQPGEALRHLLRQRQAEQAAPVLADQHDVAKVEPLDEAKQHLPVPLEAVQRGFDRFVGAAEADQVGRDHAQAGRREHRDHVTVQIAPRRIAVQAEGRHRRVCIAFIEMVDAQRVRPGEAVDVVGGERKTGQRDEAIVGRAQDFHVDG